MGLSIIREQHNIILHELENITQGDWKCLVVDETSKKILDNTVKQDDILNHNIATIERIEDRRDPNPGMDVIYFFSPVPHIVDCLLADLECRRYRRAFLIWTSLIDPSLRRRIDDFPGIKQLRASTKTLFVDFYPRESHLVTFRDPWSFPMLFHPACNSLVPKHMRHLAQRIASVCITLGEYPKVRYYRPKDAFHEASVLCTHLAKFVQEELDGYAHWDPNFPPPSSRPQANLVITDRSMDLMAPLVHEFSYQAMAHDLLPIKDGEKVIFNTIVNQGAPDEQEKDMELSEKDKIWVENRHRHMKDTIDKLMSDFRKFLQQNPHFTNEEANTTSLNVIRDMLAGLPEFQELKKAYSLHLTMAQECMNKLQANKLPEIASVEQSLSTGLDEDFRKPKNILEPTISLLDDDAVTSQDRLRLIIMYVLYRGGVIPEDTAKLLAHASLPPQESEVVTNIELLGGRTSRLLKEPRQPPSALFPKDPKSLQANADYSLSRFEPVLKSMLDQLARGALDQSIFPYVKPPMDPNEDLLAAQSGSLRAGRPNWASAGRRPPENRQRIIVFMAGGATYSESRACYEVGRERSRDIVLATSHMLTPQLFLCQLGDLSRDRRRLDLPIERPKPRAPAHLYERATPPAPPPPPPPQPRRHAEHNGPPFPPNVAPGGQPRQSSPSGLPSRPRPGPAVAAAPPPPTKPTGGMHVSTSAQPISVGGGGHGAAADPPRQEEGKPPKEKKRGNFLGMKK